MVFLAVTVAACFGSSPFGWFYFHMVSPVAVAANLVAVPVAFFVMSLGAMAIGAALFSSWLAAIFNNANWLLAKIILLAVDFCAALPGGHFYVALPRWHSPQMELTDFDFQTGSSLLLHTRHANWLFDAGREGDYAWTLRGNLQLRGINRLDALWLRRASVGSLGGAPEVVEEFAPREIYNSPLADRSVARRDFLALLEQLQRTDHRPVRGEEFQMDAETKVRVLFPPRDLEINYADDKALVLQIIRPHLRILLMSSSGFLTENWLLRQSDDLRADILMKGINAHDPSGLPDFLSRVQPKVVITGYDPFRNDHGIAPEWAQMLAARGIALFRQDETGAVEISEDADSWTVQSFLTPQSFTSRAR